MSALYRDDQWHTHIVKFATARLVVFSFCSMSRMNGRWGIRPMLHTTDLWERSMPAILHTPDWDRATE